MERIAVIKADDLRVPNEKWQRFVQIAEDKDIKVSIGIIAYGFPEKDTEAVQWVRDLQQSGRVEFWNHGWDHNIWKDENGGKVTEFSKSGLGHQKGNLEKAQKKIERIVGERPTIFGAPFNAMDLDTLRALEDHSEFKGIFLYHNKEPLKSHPVDELCMLYMNLPGEGDGTGKPNFDKFRAKYESRKNEITFAALQFHPPYFSPQGFEEFTKIIDFLKAEGWSIMLPSEYIAYSESHSPEASL
ncbi:MAG: DUF2334 domain-containing protein [Puniceicoccales bacterium]